MTPTKLLGLLPVIVYIVALQILGALGIRDVLEHRLPLPVLNGYSPG